MELSQTIKGDNKSRRRRRLGQRPGNNNTESKRWTDLFVNNRVYEMDMTLQLIQQEGNRVHLAMENIESIEKSMGFCLVSKFLGRFPGWKVFKELTKRWNVPHKMFTHHNL